MNIKSTKNFTSNEIVQIAKLHAQNIKGGFLSSLGERFLSLMYISIQRKGILIGVRKNDEIIGFVSGVSELNHVYIEFMKKNFIKALIILLPRIFSFSVLRKIIDIALYPFQKKNEEIQVPKAELLSIVVGEEYRGSGIADLLYQKLIEDFISRDIMEFKIIVGEALVSAQKFYEKKGAIKSLKINIHKGESSWVYIHQIA